MGGLSNVRLVRWHERSASGRGCACCHPEQDTDAARFQVIAATPVDVPSGSMLKSVCDVTASMWISHLERAVPEAVLGSDFLAQHAGGHGDSVTHVEREKWCVFIAHKARPIWRLDAHALRRADSCRGPAPLTGLCRKHRLVQAAAKMRHR